MSLPSLKGGMQQSPTTRAQSRIRRRGPQEFRSNESTMGSAGRRQCEARRGYLFFVEADNRACLRNDSALVDGSLAASDCTPFARRQHKAFSLTTGKRGISHHMAAYIWLKDLRKVTQYSLSAPASPGTAFKASRFRGLTRIGRSPPFQETATAPNFLRA